MSDQRLAMAAIPTVPIDGPEKSQQYELPQGGSLPIEGDTQAATDSYPELPSSSGGEDSYGQACQQASVEGHSAHDKKQCLSRFVSRSSTMPTPPPDGGFAAWMCGTYKA